MTATKAFKCKNCDEVFPSRRERFVHDGLVHSRQALTDKRAEMRELESEMASTVRQSGRATFSDVSDDGRCPNCGGTEFTAKRSVKGKIGFGLLARKSQVRCVSCGTMFKRG